MIRRYEASDRERVATFPLTNMRARRFWERHGYAYEKDAVTGDGVHENVLKKEIE